MILCRVDGSAVTSLCHEAYKGWRLLVCQPVDEGGGEEGALLLAIDCLGAGLHQRVLVTTDGKSIRERVGMDRAPIRFMTIGILDD